MPERTLASKLQIKPGQSIAVINAPDHYITLLGDVPEGATIAHEVFGVYDAVHLFVYHKDDVDQHTPGAIAAVKAGGLLWIMYPKKSGAIKTDISRDNGWDAVTAAGWDPVMQISIDATWSALRFKPLVDIAGRDVPFSQRNKKA